MKILVNGYNLYFGGGEKILDQTLSNFNSSGYKIDAFVPSSKLNEYNDKYSEVCFYKLPKLFEMSIFSVFVYTLIFPLLLIRFKPDLIVSLGNFAIRSKVKQLLYVHWPYAVYPRDSWGDDLSPKEIFNRKIRLALFDFTFKYASKIIVQTETMKERIVEKFSMQKNDVFIISPSVDFYSTSNTFKKSNIGHELILFYPALYYPHKNHNIILELALMAKNELKHFRFIVTIQDCEFRDEFFNLVKEKALSDYVVNAGVLDKNEIFEQYKKSDLVFMPSLLETFGLPFIEAMNFGLPIVASNRDFSRTLCGDAALYFDPQSASNAYTVIQDAINNIERLSTLSAERSKYYKASLDNQISILDLINGEK